MTHTSRLLALVLCIGAASAQADGRMRPPADLDCPRNQLTSYIGVPTRYARTKDRITVRIATESQTVESVTIEARGPDEARRWLRVDGQPFAAADWPRIERQPGQLRPGLRVAAWVCDDGRNPLVEFYLPKR